MPFSYANISEFIPKIDTFHRIIGSYQGDIPGPNLVFFGAIHGNELAGVYALKKVLDELHNLRPEFKGNFYAISGNLKAIEQKKRYIGKDLNRIWFPGCIIPKEEREIIPEYHEKIEILSVLKDIVANDHLTLVFDLHTTSSQSVPFVSISDTLKNRKLIQNLPVHLVLGLEELLDGPMFSFFSELGVPAVLFEAGQHEAVSSFENHVAFIWLMLHKLKCLKKKDIPDFNSHKVTLKKNTMGKRRIYEIKYRHLIDDCDNFRMKEGFVNFQKVKAGQTIAYDKNGKIKAPRSGRIFMPLYQPQGRDGFFIVKEIKPFWFRLSNRTRKWKLDSTISLFPGIKKLNNGQNAYLIDKTIARWKVISLLHLFGYRKMEYNGNSIVMSRRPYDKVFPESVEVRKNIEEYLEEMRK